MTQSKKANDTLFLCQGGTSANDTGSINTDYIMYGVYELYLIFKVFQAQGSLFIVAVDADLGEREKEIDTSSPCSSIVLRAKKIHPEVRT